MKRIVFSFLFTFLLNLAWSKSEIQKIPEKGTDSLKYYIHIINHSPDTEKLLSSFQYLQNKQVENKKEEPNLIQVYHLIYLARVQRKLGFLSDSEQSAIKALEIADALTPTAKLQAYQNTLYNHLGQLYWEMGIYKSALYFYGKALKNTSLYEKSVIFNNIGNVYKIQQQDSLAINYFQKAIELSSTTNHQENLARSQDNLGHLLIKKQSVQALSNLQQALWLREKFQDQEGLFTSYIHLSEYYSAAQQNQKAEQFLEKAKQIANRFDNLKYKEAALYKILQLTGPSEAQNYLIVKDSLENIQNTTKNKYLSLQYQINKVEKQAEILEIEKIKEEQQKLIYQLIGAIILISGVFIYFYQQIKYRKQKEEQVFLTESRIAKKVHDEVANDIYQFMVKLEKDSNVQEERLDELENIYHTSRNISHQYKTIPETEDFGQLLQEMFLNYQTDNLKIIIKNISTIQWAKIASIKKNTIYRIAQELMTNMKKHSNAKLVLWDFSQEGKKIKITYTDNGKGTKLEKKNGLLNTESRIDAIKGSINFESQINQGFKVEMII